MREIAGKVICLFLKTGERQEVFELSPTQPGGQQEERSAAVVVPDVGSERDDGAVVDSYSADHFRFARRDEQVAGEQADGIHGSEVERATDHVETVDLDVALGRDLDGAAAR